MQELTKLKLTIEAGLTDSTKEVFESVSKLECQRLLSVIFTVLLSVSVFSQNTLTIHQKDGQQFSFGFEDKPVVSFSDTDLIVKSTKTELTYALSSVSKFTFNDIEDAVIGIKDNSSKASLYLDEYTVCISGAEPDRSVALLGIDGKVLSTYKTDANGSATFSIAELSAGTYIINSESLTCKIIKK